MRLEPPTKRPEKKQPSLPAVPRPPRLTRLLRAATISPPHVTSTIDRAPTVLGALPARPHARTSEAKRSDAQPSARARASAVRHGPHPGPHCALCARLRPADSQPANQPASQPHASRVPPSAPSRGALPVRLWPNPGPDGARVRALPYG